MHNFKRQPGKKEGAMGGGTYMERPKPAEHFFGTSEDGKILPHVGKALNLPALKTYPPSTARATSTSAQSGEDALLREIRERYTYASEAWEEVRKERQKDMRYICGNPWEDDDRKAREAAGRPVVNHDELNQYVSQAVNNLRQNKRGIKVEPGGNGADGKSAQVRQDLIRTIEYRNKAQDAYLRAGQDMLEGSYGYFRIGRKYVIDDPQDDDPHAFDQEITLGAIPNPDSVLYCPDTKQPDWSDAEYCFVGAISGHRLSPVDCSDSR